MLFRLNLLGFYLIPIEIGLAEIGKDPASG